MARRIENECAFCAEEIAAEKEIVGKDWKVYCSENCAESGEVMSLEEWRKVMRIVTARNDLFIQEWAA
jgi:hypothetical protein